MVSLFSAKNVQRLFVGTPQTFAAFPRLGMMLLVMIGEVRAAVQGRLRVPGWSEDGTEIPTAN